MISRTFRSSRFWIPFLATLIPTAYFLAWELQLIDGLTPLSRPAITMLELIFAGLVLVLLPLNIGLALWQARYGHCPRGTKRASGIAGMMGALTLICPVCIALPATLLGVGTILTVLTPFLPLLRLIAIILLVTATYLIWPRKES